MKKRSVFAAMAAMLAMSVLLISGCGKTESSFQDTGEPEPVKQFEIETPRGTLFMPDTWGDSLKVEIEEGGTEVHFNAMLEDDEYPLFDVTISETVEESEGTIKGSDGKERNVAVELAEAEGIDLLPSELQDQFYAMQEDVNYLIAQLGA